MNEQSGRSSSWRRVKKRKRNENDEVGRQEGSFSSLGRAFRGHLGIFLRRESSTLRRSAALAQSRARNPLIATARTSSRDQIDIAKPQFFTGETSEGAEEGGREEEVLARAVAIAANRSTGLTFATGATFVFDCAVSSSFLDLALYRDRIRSGINVVATHHGEYFLSGPSPRIKSRIK